MIEITQIGKNRIEVTDAVRNRTCEMEAAFLANRAYYRLIPLGSSAPAAWQLFWDLWNLNKDALKQEGISVTKERGLWVIHYSPKTDIF